LSREPKLRRYWFDFTLRYPKKKMPDPKGAMRLVKHGVRVPMTKATVEDPKTGKEPVEDEAATDWPQLGSHDLDSAPSALAT
jgi:hypothetical protein